MTSSGDPTSSAGEASLPDSRWGRLATLPSRSTIRGQATNSASSYCTVILPQQICYCLHAPRQKRMESAARLHNGSGFDAHVELDLRIQCCLLGRRRVSISTLSVVSVCRDTVVSAGNPSASGGFNLHLKRLIILHSHATAGWKFGMLAMNKKVFCFV